MARLTYASARAICSTFGFNPFEDFHAMSSGSKEAVIRAADSVKYKAPKSRNGSRGRYFAAYVRRIIERGDK
ncbi:hypothetical protein RZ532_01035 [Nitratireductor aquimarinus]|uniref:hypothetical protein n=1 Tax=Nitratireductor aquimarinus TaxID=889300 RepID=UPI002935D21B|nr:hypothetical protein [Nitratireductor aquimarinus]MDV2964545.1 hypothetical protein [Nitratireductor aquimarinus]